MVSDLIKNCVEKKFEQSFSQGRIWILKNSFMESKKKTNECHGCLLRYNNGNSKVMFPIFWNFSNSCDSSSKFVRSLTEFKQEKPYTIKSFWSFHSTPL